MTPPPVVSVILLNWNGLQDTLECLDSLAISDYPNFNVIVVDNGSTDGSPEAIRSRYPEADLVINGRNIGFAGGNNAGMRKALETGADLVWLLNNDTVVEGSTLSQLVSASMESEEIGLASPVIHFYDQRDAVQFRGSYVDWEKKRIILQKETKWDTDNNRRICLWGTALLIKSSSMKKVGLLNEKYFAYHEDEEYSMRFLRAGYRNIVVPRARIFHKNSRSTGNNDAPFQVFLRARNTYFLWMDTLKGVNRFLHIPRYLGDIIAYGSTLKEKKLTESVEACMDGVWHAFRGVGGPRDPEVAMPFPLRKLFQLLFTWHPFFWSSLLRGDISAISANFGKRFRSANPPA